MYDTEIMIEAILIIINKIHFNNLKTKILTTGYKVRTKIALQWKAYGEQTSLHLLDYDLYLPICVMYSSN